MSKNSHSDAEDILSELETQSEESESTKPEAIQESKTIEESNTKTIEESNTKTIEESNTKTINEKKRFNPRTTNTKYNSNWKETNNDICKLNSYTIIIITTCHYSSTRKKHNNCS